ncbi:MAG: outer membrane beta-barrel protein [Candidatus Omnitrophica bacterium]|nr:outer membrane beta-barrel protein [Candidatus Omnitrophota bacterium]
MSLNTKNILSGLVVSLFIIISSSTAVFANEIEELRNEIKMMKEKLSAMEARLQQSEARAADAEKPKTGPEGTITDAITSITKEIEFHGFVDTSYIFNTNTPVPPNPRTNNLRVFDTDANGFMLNMAQLSFEKTVSKESPLGFRVDLDFGQDAKLIHSNGLGNPGDEFDLEQAYAQFCIPFSLPLMDTLSFKFGKFVTLMGAEVIESVNNWNFSRSYLFGYAIPFTHTGLRAYYKPFADIPVESYIGIVNGWDQVDDLNRAKTLEAQIAVTPNDKLSFSLGGMFGPERADSNKDFRDLIDFVITYQPLDKLTLKANYDYGWERNGTSAFAGYTDGKDASWDGVAGYAKYDIFDWWSIAGRGEFFHDRNGVRTGVLTSSTMPISDLAVWEFTLTNEFKIFKNFIARFEYRFDKASGQAFTKNKTTANNQSTIAAEVITKF